MMFFLSIHCWWWQLALSTYFHQSPSSIARTSSEHRPCCPISLLKTYSVRLPDHHNCRCRFPFTFRGDIFLLSIFPQTPKVILFVAWSFTIKSGIISTFERILLSSAGGLCVLCPIPMLSRLAVTTFLPTFPQSAKVINSTFTILFTFPCCRTLMTRFPSSVFILTAISVG